MGALARLAALGGGAEQLYVDDVFSAFTYTGNGSTQSINNGIDLAGKGGMVWIKARGASGQGNVLADTARGANKSLYANSNDAQQTLGIGSFASNGFGLVNDSQTNFNNDKFASWTFRKAPKFFDVVTYTGNGSGSSRQINHALGVQPGLILIKATSGAGNWSVWHRGSNGLNIWTELQLNGTKAGATYAIGTSQSATYFDPSSVYETNGPSTANANGVSYVAYLFAHDAAADGMIQCGSFTTDAGGNATVNLGWEPQFVLYKRVSTTGNWWLADSARKFANNGTVAATETLLANSTGAAVNDNAAWYPTATGFQMHNQEASSTMVYMAIRRPNKPPTSGTQVFNAIARTGTGVDATKVTGVGFAPDLMLGRDQATDRFTHAVDRLRGSKQQLFTNSQNAEVAGNSTALQSFDQDGVTVGINGDFGASGVNYINWFFKRAPGVFDEVCYTGNGSIRSIPHSLGVTPELMIVKRRSGIEDWCVYHQAVGPSLYLKLNSTTAATGTADVWDSTPNASTFNVGTNASANLNGSTYVVYLFATKAGVSKVGSYTGNGGSQSIDCGFSTGARFVLIKSRSAAGDWALLDSVRGIVSADDPYIFLNSTNAEAAIDCIDPHSSGFTVNHTGYVNINELGSSYIYLAFA